MSPFVDAVELHGVLDRRRCRRHLGRHHHRWRHGRAIESAHNRWCPEHHLLLHLHLRRRLGLRHHHLLLLLGARDVLALAELVGVQAQRQVILILIPVPMSFDQTEGYGLDPSNPFDRELMTTFVCRSP